jgi:dipeptidyl aminopeptidase/acylaminoacyl peptidase
MLFAKRVHLIGRIACFAMLPAIRCAQGAEPLSAADLWNWRGAAGARISSDGGRVVYVEGWNDRERDAACSNLFLVQTGGKDRRRLTEGPWRDTRPRWSPDGTRVAYLSDRGGPRQIRVWSEAADTALATPGQEPLELAWSPDGASLAYTARVPAAPRPVPWAPAAILPQLAGYGRSDGRIFVVPARGGAARAVSGESPDCRGEPAWMPDGRAILTSTADGDLVSLRVADGAVSKLAAGGRNECPRVSPDGAKIAWLSTQAKPQTYVVRKLWVMNADGSRARPLSGSLDRDAASPEWSSDSRTVYFLADDRGATHVYVARNDATVRQLTEASERLRGFSLADDGTAVTVRSTAAEPDTVTAFSVYRASEEVTLARVNQVFLAGRRAGAIEEAAYESAGRTIHAWLVKPPDFDAGKKYPLLLDIRDGMRGPEFDLRAQTFAARGYVVLCANARGTPGYGEAFGNLLRTGIPGDPYDDLMRGVDAAIAKGYIDTRRLLVAGGMLAAWAIGHTDRFAAAVVRYPFAAVPGDEPGESPTRSPLAFARSFRTPTLVLARERDGEAGELHAALEARHVDCALARLPDSPRPSERILEWETVLGWLGK